jgi:hypothetical protein
MTVHCSEINNKITAIMCERQTPMHDFARILSASLGPSKNLTEAPPPSGMAVNSIKQLQILAEILTTSALVEDKEHIMQQVLRNFVSVLTAAYDDSELEVAGLREQAAADLEYVLNTIRRLPVSEKIIQGCTQTMVALHLRKVSSIQAHKQAAVAAAAGSQLPAKSKPVEDEQELVIKHVPEQSLMESPLPAPPPPPPQQEEEGAEEEVVKEVAIPEVAKFDYEVEPAANIEVPLD